VQRRERVVVRRPRLPAAQRAEPVDPFLEVRHVEHAVTVAIAQLQQMGHPAPDRIVFIHNERSYANSHRAISVGL